MGRYTLYSKIATGGMATVYFGRLAGPSGFARTVAVKCLHPQFAENPDFSAMFLDEARLATRIRSPYVVPTLDVVSEQGELAIVMEYIHGESLGALLPFLSDSGAHAEPVPRSDVPVAVAVSVLDDVLQGLQAAHDARSEQGAPLGIVHRDVSPHNILVGTDGLAHLIDFGVAKAAGRLQTTREGQLKGKLAYMAPEQLRGEPVTRRSDLYAASVVLWEALVGEPLFRADDEGGTVTRVLMGEVVPPSKAVRKGRSSADAHAIERLDAVVMRGLDRDPTRRFETAHEMAVALQRCLAPASAPEVARWLEQTAAPALERRAASIAAIEAQPQGGATSVRRARSISLMVAGVVLLSAAIAAARIPWRSSATPRVGAATASPVATSTSQTSNTSNTSGGSSLKEDSDRAPAESGFGGVSDHAGSSPPPPIVAPPPTAATPPKRAPAAARPSDCNPPFTWDDQGKKHYKRQCL
jgi:serine/threonine protein kinase